MADFLLELRSEEIPARMQAGARAELEKLFRRELETAGVVPGDITVWSTPRRLALIARDLPAATEATREEAKGPPVGAPDKAVDGFCRKMGLSRDDLETREVKGRDTYFAVMDRPGQDVADLLAAAIPAIIADFSWPKSMRWGEGSISSESLRWVRPLSGIIALLDGEVVPVVLDGLASGRETFGHRFHSDGPIAIESPHDYAAKLRAASVIVDQDERADRIRSGARQAAEAGGLALIEDEGLVIENAGLTEWPVPLLGRFDDAFLDVPPEVIQLTARVNQKYFVCEAANDTLADHLANAFVCTANIASADPAVVVDGNRKVLAARLSDARFFWEQDRKKTLEQHAEGLSRITFHEKLGTVADKVERVARLARWLVEEGIVGANVSSREGGRLPEGRTTHNVSPREGGDLPEGSATAGEVPAFAGTREELANLAEQAARLCKADLVTEMVGEFPELQGVMGGHYARAEGLPDEVADAIRDHYKPVGQGDDVPTAPVTVAVSLADKLDTLAGFFYREMPPSGSKDPFALRRAAIAVVLTIVSARLRVPLSKLIDFAMGGFATSDANEEMQGHGDRINAAAQELGVRPELAERYLHNELAERGAGLSHYIFPEELLDFLADRLKVQQREAGVRHDLIDAVFALGGEDDLVRLLARVKALQSFVETEDGENLLAGYKRTANILKKEGWDADLPRASASSPRSPAKAGAQDVGDHGGGDRVQLNPRLRGEAQNERGDAVAQTGEEDPLALAGKPEFDAAMRSGTQNAGAKGGVDALSYSPEPAEKALIDALDTAERDAAQAIREERFEQAMAALASLRYPIDAFFEEVTVNDDDPAKRSARLDLLARFTRAVHEVADFGRIEG